MNLSLISHILYTLVADETPAAKSLDSLKGDASMLKNLSVEDLINKLANLTVDFAIKLVVAFVVFYIGKLIINKLYRLIRNILVRRKVELSLSTFILSLFKIALMFLLIIIVIGILGIETSSFIAIFASAGVAIGMALSGTLQNFAGGVLVLLIKPYKVGDYIEAQGYAGTVKEIQIFYTVLNTIDNKSIIIPNGALSTGSINNYSKERYRRVDWTVAISYGDDYNVAKETAMRLVREDSRIVQPGESTVEDTPEEAAEQRALEALENNEEKQGFLKRLFGRGHAKIRQVSTAADAESNITIAKPVNRSPFIGLTELADSSVNIVIRCWTRSENYWAVFFDMNEKIYTEFPKAGLNFPFPQMDVHVKKGNE